MCETSLVVDVHVDKINKVNETICRQNICTFGMEWPWLVSVKYAINFYFVRLVVL